MSRPICPQKSLTDPLGRSPTPADAGGYPFAMSRGEIAGEREGAGESARASERWRERDTNKQKEREGPTTETDRQTSPSGAGAIPGRSSSGGEPGGPSPCDTAAQECKLIIVFDNTLYVLLLLFPIVVIYLMLAVAAPALLLLPLSLLVLAFNFLGPRHCDGGGWAR